MAKNMGIETMRTICLCSLGTVYRRRCFEASVMALIVVRHTQIAVIHIMSVLKVIPIDNRSPWSLVSGRAQVKLDGASSSSSRARRLREKIVSREICECIVNGSNDGMRVRDFY